MSAVLKLVRPQPLSDDESALMGPITEEDLLYMQLDTAGRKLRSMERLRDRAPWGDNTPEFYDALREYNDAIDSAREHAKKLRELGFQWSPLIDQLMRAHKV